MAQIKYFIWGSCVSRDTAAFLPDDWRLLGYVARQSVISAGNVVELAEPLAEIGSPFVQRASDGDVAGHALERITERADQLDLLLLDLCDERHGVFEVAPGQYLTRSVERMKAGVDVRLCTEYRLLEFGSLEHLQVWAEHLIEVVGRLNELDLMDRTIVLAPQWATESVQGTATPISFGLRAARANQMYELYYAALEEIGLPLVARDVVVLGDDEHKWGPAPFHYAEQTYRTLVSLIEGAASRD